MANQWNSGIHDRKLKELICEIGLSTASQAAP